MDIWQLRFLVKTERYHVVTFHCWTEQDESGIGAYITGIADGLRVLMPAACRVLFGAAWRVDGPLSPRSDVRVFHRPTMPASDLQELAGARQSPPCHAFTFLRAGIDTVSAFPITHLLPGAVCDVDIPAYAPANRISLFAQSPLLALCLPWFNAVVRRIEGFDQISADTSGEAHLTSARDPVLTPHMGIHSLQREREWARTPDGAKVMLGRLVSAHRLACAACVDLQDRMTRFDQRWGDNHTPEETGAQYISDAITAGAIYFDLAHAIGSDIGHLLPGYAFTSHRQIEYSAVTDATGHPIRIRDYIRETWSYIESAPFRIRARGADIVADCLGTLSEAVLFLRSAQAALELVRLAHDERAGRQTSDYIAQAATLWVAQWWTDMGQHFIRTYEGDNPPDIGHEWLVYKPKCQRQQELFAEWQALGGNDYARAYYEVFNGIANAMQAIKRSLALILLSIKPAPAGARAHWEIWDGISHAPVGKEPYVRRDFSDTDFHLLGTACDWIETRAAKRGTFLTCVVPCNAPEVALRLKPRPEPPKPVIWDNTIHDSQATQFDYVIGAFLDGKPVYMNRYYQDRHDGWNDRDSQHVYPWEPSWRETG